MVGVCVVSVVDVSVVFVCVAGAAVGFFLTASPWASVAFFCGLDLRIGCLADLSCFAHQPWVLVRFTCP